MAAKEHQLSTQEWKGDKHSWLSCLRRAAFLYIIFFSKSCQEFFLEFRKLSDRHGFWGVMIYNDKDAKK